MSKLNEIVTFKLWEVWWTKEWLGVLQKKKKRCLIYAEIGREEKQNSYRKQPINTRV